MLTYSTRMIGLIGFVWTDEGNERLQTLVIDKGKITRIMEGRGDLSDLPGIVQIELDAETVIFPGLLNLHTHIGYNILPIWESHQVWKNRFQWRNNTDYKKQVGGLLDFIQQNWSGHTNAQAIVSEIQAVAGGTTLIQETLGVVDFYRPDVTPSGDAAEDTGGWELVAQPTYTSFVQSVNNNNSPYYATLIHVGEGKTGFVKGSAADPYSRKEVDTLFRSLTKDIADPGKLTGSRLAISHGCGIDLDNAALLELVRTHQISWIWSPVSNLLLYRDTLDVRRLLEKGINVCLGSDWSPSGSKHVKDELKFARFVNQLLDLQISDRELLKMVTGNPAQALGLTQSGALRVGANADLFVVRREREEEDAVAALLESSDADIDFVMVNGRIIFGLTRYFDEDLKVDYQLFPPAEGEAVAKRGVSINSGMQFDLAGSLRIMDTLLEQYGSSVLGEPGLRRTKFMAADDRVYRERISALKDELTHMYWR